MAVTKFQILLNDLLLKHKASLLIYEEICHLSKQYISSPNFHRFAKFKSRRSLLTSTQNKLNSKALQPINSTVRLHDNSLVTVPVFYTKHMITSLLLDPSVMNEKNFAEGCNVLTGEVDNHLANNKYGEVHTGDAWLPARDRYCQTPLHKITKEEYTNLVAQYWSTAAQNSLDVIKNAILADPCILRFDYW
jgi:hypothetical protein